MAHARSAGARDTGAYRTCQRRLEYLGSRLQDLAVEIGDGQGAVWLKENMWFLNNEAKYFDDVLFSVGKICNHLVTYLTFHKQKLASCFPFLSYMGILYEVGEILGIVRDILCANPKETLSVKQSQIEMFWSDCTPFLFLFENNNYLLLNTQQISVYMKALMDLLPTVVQMGLFMYATPEAQLRGFECFADTCLKLSRALVDQGDFLGLAEAQEPVIVPFLRQWIIYALELVQNGVQVRTEKAMILSPRITKLFAENGHEDEAADNEYTVPKSLNMLSLSNSSTLPDEVAESSLAPLRIHNSTSVRASCQPYKWISIAETRLVPCANENRKLCIEEICLKENQRIVSDIYLVSGGQPRSWRGVKMHCPLTKCYDDLRVKLFIKLKNGEKWVAREGEYEALFGKGVFLTFDGCTMDGFVAIEERPMVSKNIGPDGGVLATDFDPHLQAQIPQGTMSKSTLVKMMVQPPDNPRERQYRDAFPNMFQHIKSTSPAVEIEGGSTCSDGNMSITIPFQVLKDTNTKILVLKYSNDQWEIKDGDDIIRPSGDNCYTVSSNNGGTVLATVDNNFSGTRSESIRQEMEVILGKKHLCKLLIFVEHQTALQISDVNTDQIVFNIVCVEKYRMADVIKDKSKTGLIELPKSQSADRLLQQTDEIHLEMKGDVELDPDLPGDSYTLTYIEGSDNFLRFPVRLTDVYGKIKFILRHGKDKSSLHTFFCNVQDILSLIAHGTIPPTSPSVYSDSDDVFQPMANHGRDTENGKENQVGKNKRRSTAHMASTSHAISLQVPPSVVRPKQRGIPVPLKRESTSSEIMQEISGPSEDAVSREASLKILNRNSLVNLAKYVSAEEGHRLGMCLGMKQEKVSHIYRMYRHSQSLASFYLLYEWRGRQTQPELADKLIQALNGIERRDLAKIVSEVRSSNHSLSPEDFSMVDKRRRSRRT